MDTTDAELVRTIGSKVINSLPLNGRRLRRISSTCTKASRIYDLSSILTTSFNGLPPDDNVYLVDGTDGTDPWTSTGRDECGHGHGR